MPQKLRELVKNIFNQNENIASQKVIGLADFLAGEARFQSFIEQLPVMFYAVDIKPPYTPFYISPAFQSLGYSLEDWQKPDSAKGQ